MSTIENPNEWVMSLDNPTRAKYEVHKLWKQGVRHGQTDKLISLGYNKHEIEILNQWFDAIGDDDFFNWYNNYYVRFFG